MTDSNSILKLEIKNGIGFLRLLAPPKNEMNSCFFEQLNILINEIGTQSSLKGVVIVAEGRHFSSGANVQELIDLFVEKADTKPEAILRNKQSFDNLQALTMPVVACIKGICFGSGLELALAAHFRIGTQNCLLSLPEAGFGIIPGLSGIFNSQRTMGKARALEFVLADKTISGTDAKKEGLIDIIADKRQLQDTAVNLIEEIAQDYKKELKVKYLLEFEHHAE